MPKETEEELDQDDDRLELIGAQQKQCVGRETFGLIVRFQRSLDVVTHLKALPEQKVNFSYYDGLQELGDKDAGRKTELHDWRGLLTPLRVLPDLLPLPPLPIRHSRAAQQRRGVIRSIFPGKPVAATSTTNTIDAEIGDDDSSDADSDDAHITADEVIAAMASYGATYKTRNTFILSTPPGNTGYSFLGCYHAERSKYCVMEKGLRRLGEVLVRQDRRRREDKKLRERRDSVNSADSKGERATSESESEGGEMVDGTRDTSGLEDVFRNRAYNKVDSKTG
ncbi:hypothetical protein EV426DRAFT_704462 [Tirmania nivea]|nr:hypothetical protein EV426DRAFT_704462 [Tirmania nivea]